MVYGLHLAARHRVLSSGMDGIKYVPPLLSLFTGKREDVPRVSPVFSVYFLALILCHSRAVCRGFQMCESIRSDNNSIHFLVRALECTTDWTHVSSVLCWPVDSLFSLHLRLEECLGPYNSTAIYSSVSLYDR